MHIIWATRYLAMDLIGLVTGPNYHWAQEETPWIFWGGKLGLDNLSSIHIPNDSRKPTWSTKRFLYSVDGKGVSSQSDFSFHFISLIS